GAGAGRPGDAGTGVRSHRRGLPASGCLRRRSAPDGRTSDSPLLGQGPRDRAKTWHCSVHDRGWGRSKERVMTTRAEIRGRIRDELNDNGSVKLWTDALLNRWIGEATKEWSRVVPR